MVKKSIGTTASLFGAGLTSMLVAPELQADVVSLSFDPGSVPFQTSTSNLINVQMSTGGGNVGSFSQWNDNIGQSLYWVDGLASWTFVQYSQTLNAATFNGVAGALNMAGGSYVGFRALSGNVGWFTYDLGGGVGGTMTYGPAGYANAGENIHVGQVPAPGALALLALGAVGVRRNRKRVA